MAASTACLLSIVRNVSGSTKKFSFLPPHGRELADGDEFSVLGNLFDVVRARPGGFVASQRYVNGLKSALEDNVLEIVQLPAPVLYDPTNEETKQLKLDGGTLYAADGCWLPTSASSSLN